MRDQFKCVLKTKRVCRANHTQIASQPNCFTIRNEGINVILVRKIQTT